MKKKYTVICVAGLTEDPEHTFSELRKRLEIDGHHVELADVSNVKSFNNRKECCEFLVKATKNDVILIGVSAGGAAVCSVAKQYKGKVQGVTLLSSALPRSIKTFWTRDLFSLFLMLFPKILLGKKIILTEKQYLSVANPLPEDTKEGCLKTMLPLYGKEVRQLIIPGIPFPDVSCPVFHAYGTKDRMLHPRAHRTYQLKLLKKLENVTPTHIHSGHFLLASEESTVLVEEISTWISNIT